MQNNVFGKRLRELRIERELTQRQLGEVLNVWNQTVSFWESGSREPDLDTLVKIAHYFEISIDELLEENH